MMMPNCVTPIYDYIFDRVSNKFEMLSLAQLIREKSALKDEGVST